MGYFTDGYPNIRIPHGNDDTPGLRRAQIGAVHAIASYFSLPKKPPGIVVMPTGSGKTAVICLSSYMVRAQRVLILTPSQLVRSQITEEVSSNRVLKGAAVLPADFPGPKVIEIKHRLTTGQMWDDLRDYDVVISTPQCASPGMEGVAAPPTDFFDLIVMDEAHHSEAPRWADILAHFKETKRLLFTATPFRRDKKELKGQVIYSYPLRQAYLDGIFGKLNFIPVDTVGYASHDIAIARQAEAIYRKDEVDGFDHRLMVRTDSKKRAEELAEIYAANTSLKLLVVHSGHALSTIRKALISLRSRSIDGIICVAMLGEGFDFPQLKIAAIHSPHKSLAVTLQFIGRFARTTGSNLGEAKFLAVPQDIQAETNELYRESAAWQEIVSNLSEARIERELRIKEMSASFSNIEIGETFAEDVVMTDFKPYFHVKIYKISDAPDLKLLPELDDGITVLRHDVSDNPDSSIILLRQVKGARWSDLEQFAQTQFDLVVIYYDENSGLLFINSSRRTLDFYKPFEEFYGNGTASLLSGPRINRVLEGLQHADFFNVGLKNTVQNSNTESYQIKSGPSAQNAISPTDGLLYQRGHLFGKGINEDGKSITIGYSSSSKVWSNYSARIGELIEWCQKLAIKLNTKGVVLTGTPLDSLLVGEEIDVLPVGVIGVGWSDNVYKDFPIVRSTHGAGTSELQLLDFDIEFMRGQSSDDVWVVEMKHIKLSQSICVSFAFVGGNPVFDMINGSASLEIIRQDSNIQILDYLRHHPLAFYLEDFSRVEGNTIHYNKNGLMNVFPRDAQITSDWQAHNIDIQREFPSGPLSFTAPSTVQELIGHDLIMSPSQVVFYDHGTGEMADFLTFEEQGSETVLIRLYHCKGSGGPRPGDRVDDAYEVCGQVVKCLIWLKTKQYLRNRIVERETSNGSVFIKGSRNDMLKTLSDSSPRKLEFEIVLVQPGIEIGALSEKHGHILGAASDYVRRACGAKMLLLGSEPKNSAA